MRTDPSVFSAVGLIFLSYSLGEAPILGPGGEVCVCKSLPQNEVYFTK